MSEHRPYVHKRQGVWWVWCHDHLLPTWRETLAEAHQLAQVHAYYHWKSS